MTLVGSGCEKAKHHLNPSPKRPKTLRNRKRKTGETFAYGTPLKTSLDQRQKMDFVGSGCEKAKHHLNPSPKRPKTLRNRKQKTGETLPTEPSKDKDKNGSRRQWMRKSQTPPKSEPKTTKNATKPKAEKLAKRCLRNPPKDKDKNVALVGSGCEKAKHHLNPSPKRPKTLRNRKQKSGETFPTEPSKDKDKNGSRRQCTTNLQAAGKTCPKTSWAFKKPANSTKLLGALPLSEGSADYKYVLYVHIISYYISIYIYIYVLICRFLFCMSIHIGITWCDPGIRRLRW